MKFNKKKNRKLSLFATDCGHIGKSRQLYILLLYPKVAKVKKKFLEGNF